jgi:Bacterial protein of unknown function (DUF922)
MASRLLNLLRVLTWNDFAKLNQSPAPGSTAEVAQTATDIVPSGIATEPIVGSSSVRLKDTIEVRIEFKPKESWVFKWVFTQQQSYQDDLLNHENGHYKIAALIGRDFFLALMKLKANTYANAAALRGDIDRAKKAIAEKAQPAQDKYDDDTKNGTDSGQQTLWDGYISKAFVTPVNPAEQAADGTPIKISFLTVLSQAGINI